MTAPLIARLLSVLRTLLEDRFHDPHRGEHVKPSGVERELRQHLGRLRLRETGITSPARISSAGPPHRWTRSTPDVTIKICPSGCVCHALRAQGSNVTYAPDARAGSVVGNSGSIRPMPGEVFQRYGRRHLACCPFP